MSGEQQATGWQITGASVRGAAHIRADRLNQDALAWLPASGAGNTLALAVSDGHGGAKYLRSHIGAQLAVEQATAIIYDFLHSQGEQLNHSALKRTSEERLPQVLVRGWQQAVSDHLAGAPLLEEERHLLETQIGSAALAKVEHNPLIAYGATLLAVGVLPGCMLYLQLGDGDMLTVAETGEVSRPPFPPDERLFGDETTSLCMPDAWRDVRVYFQTLAGTPPALVLLATDGYGKSFRDEAGFLAVGSDLLDIIRSDGLEAVGHNLPAWLSEASRAGSGDDVTLGVLYRVGA